MEGTKGGLRMIQRALVVMLLLVPVAASAVTPAAMQADIQARYKPTVFDKLGFLKESGSVLVVRREGLRGGRPGRFNRTNLVRDGQLVEAGGGSVPLGGGLDGVLKQGDRLRLHGVRVDESAVELDLATLESHVVTGSRSAVQLQAIVRFHYDAGLASLTSRRVLDDLELWLGSENALRISKTVRQGQSPEEVTAILGEPEKKVLLDAKTLYIYSDMRLIFRDGRLVDLE